MKPLTGKMHHAFQCRVRTSDMKQVKQIRQAATTPNKQVLGAAPSHVSQPMPAILPNQSGRAPEHQWHPYREAPEG